MKIKWLGHSAFIVTSDTGVRILTDPYQSDSYDGDLAYGTIREQAEVVTVSHIHADHYEAKSVPSGAALLKSPGSRAIRGVPIKGITTCHDETGGRQRGLNTVFVMEIDGMHLCHLGDLGHVLSAGDRDAIGRVDVLLIPVGGYYTIDAGQATQVVEALVPRIAIPMHYRNDKCSFPIAGVGDFLTGKKLVRRLDLSAPGTEPGQSEVEIARTTLPRDTEIWVLRHAL